VICAGALHGTVPHAGLFVPIDGDPVFEVWLAERGSHERGIRAGASLDCYSLAGCGDSSCRSFSSSDDPGVASAMSSESDLRPSDPQGESRGSDTKRWLIRLEQERFHVSPASLVASRLPDREPRVGSLGISLGRHEELALAEAYGGLRRGHASRQPSPSCSSETSTALSRCISKSAGILDDLTKAV
jgi:hypothetical protein